jgi:hypothetical protein
LGLGSWVLGLGSCSGFLGSCVLGFLGSWVLGFLGSGVLGFLGSWVLGFLCSGFLGSWVLGSGFWFLLVVFMSHMLVFRLLSLSSVFAFRLSRVRESTERHLSPRANQGHRQTSLFSDLSILTCPYYVSFEHFDMKRLDLS